MQQRSLQPHYLTQLRSSGIFTEGDLLELEDHFFTIYEAELDNGKPTHLALQRAEQALGKREEVIAAFAQKRKRAWAKDLGSFFVFGLVVNLLGLWCLGTGINNLSTIISYSTNLDNLAPILMPGLMISFIVFVASWQWKLLRYSADLPGKLPQLFERVKLKRIALILLIPLFLSLATDPLVIYGVSNRHIAPWDIPLYTTNSKIWFNFYTLSLTALTTFFGWQAYQKHLKKERVSSLWSLRLFFFFMAGLSLPYMSVIDIFILESLQFNNREVLMKYFLFVSRITAGLETGLMLLFPLAYRHIWQRKQYLA